MPTEPRINGRLRKPSGGVPPSRRDGEYPWRTRDKGILPVDELERVGRCPGCRSDRLSGRWVRAVGLEVVGCASCGLAYLDPRPTWTSMLDHYEHDYAFLPISRQWEDARAFDSMREDVERIDRLRSIKGASVLDVGCGPGVFLESLKRKGAATVFGIEPSEDVASFARHHVSGATVLASTWESADEQLRDRRFDVVSGLDLIEHLYAPREFLRWARTRLTDNGICYLKTPNWGAVSRFGEAWPGLAADFEHVCYFTGGTLSSMLAQEGFEVRSIEYEPARAGLAGELGSGSKAPRGKEVVREAAKKVPGLNRAAYRGLQAARRWRRKDDIRTGTADVLVVVAST